MVLKKTLENPWHSKEIKPVNPKGNQPRILIGRTNVEAEAPILWPPFSWPKTESLFVCFPSLCSFHYLLSKQQKFSFWPFTYHEFDMDCLSLLFKESLLKAQLKAVTPIGW